MPQRNIFRYRDIADLSSGGIGGHYSKWPPISYVENVCM